MSIKIDNSLTPAKLKPAIERLFELSATKIASLEKSWNPAKGTPVFTINGKYTSRGWTEWTQGFQFG
ncbi:MAG TPA: glycosyl hydrolase, partial [Verrucomicrobiae bacterium]|nr:glycosyl hydrolase [Verrucomicrobiae bacterium]